MVVVEFTGTPTHVTNTDHADGSQTVTIPDDCTAVIVLSWMWKDAHAGDFGELNWDNGSTLDFTQIVTNKSASDAYDVWAYMMTSDSGDWPGTGSKTLYWAFTAGVPIEGGTVVIVFVKNLDTSDPIRSIDSDKGNADWAATLTNIEAGDLSFLCAVVWEATNIDAIGSGQIALDDGASDNLVDWNVSSELAEGSPSYSTSAGDTIYNGAIAFALKPFSSEDKTLIGISPKSPDVSPSPESPDTIFIPKVPEEDIIGRDGDA